MDTIKLIKEIESKIRKAEEYLPRLITMLQKQEELKLMYRIKDKKRILEKVMLFASKPEYQGMDEKQILDAIGDIIGLTIVVGERLNPLDSYEMLGKIMDNFEGGNGPIKVKRFIDHIAKGGGHTGYQCLLVQYDNEEGIPFEIQIVDDENLKLREETHEEFKRVKYEQEQVKNAPNEQKVEESFDARSN